MTEEELDSLRQAIQDAVPAKVARMAGIRPSTLYSFLDGKTANMRADTRDKVIAALNELSDEREGSRPGIPQIKGVTPASKLGQQNAASRRSANEVALLPVYDVTASAGPGSIVEDGEPIDYYPISLSLLQSLTRSPAEMVGVIQVRGNSMEPDLKHGDLIFVDRTINRLAGDFVYVLDRGGYTQVKYLQAMHSTKTIKVKSANKTFDDDEVTEEEISIAGKVIAVFRGIG